jgi:hypothetical protein
MLRLKLGLAGFIVVSASLHASVSSKVNKIIEGTDPAGIFSLLKESFPDVTISRQVSSAGPNLSVKIKNVVCHLDAGRAP